MSWISTFWILSSKTRVFLTCAGAAVSPSAIVALLLVSPPQPFYREPYVEHFSYVRTSCSHFRLWISDKALPVKRLKNLIAISSDSIPEHPQLDAVRVMTWRVLIARDLALCILRMYFFAAQTLQGRFRFENFLHADSSPFLVPVLACYPLVPRRHSFESIHLSVPA